MSVKAEPNMEWIVFSGDRIQWQLSCDEVVGKGKEVDSVFWVIIIRQRL